MGVHNVHENNAIRRRGPVIQLDRESLERKCFVDNALWVTYLTEGVSLYEECNLY